MHSLSVVFGSIDAAQQTEQIMFHFQKLIFSRLPFPCFMGKVNPGIRGKNMARAHEHLALSGIISPQVCTLIIISSHSSSELHV